MTQTSLPSPLRDARDTILAAVSVALQVPVGSLMRSRGRQTERVSDARAVAMWVLTADVDRLGVPELEDLLGTTWRTIDRSWQTVQRNPKLFAVAQALIETHGPMLSRLPKVRAEEDE